MTRAAVVVADGLTFGWLLGGRLVNMLVVPEVMRLGRVGLVLAIRRRACPGELDRQEQGEKKDEPALHGVATVAQCCDAMGASSRRA